MAFKFWTDLWDGSLLGTLSKIRNELTSIQPQDSTDIVWERTQSGVKAYFAETIPSGGEQSGETEPTQVVSGSPSPERPIDTVMARVTATSAIGYTVALYGDGIDQPATGTAILFLPEVALDAPLPIGAYVIAHLSQVQITGGN